MYIVTLIISSLNSPLTFLLFSKIENRLLGIIGGVLTLVSMTLWTKGFAPSVIQFLYPMGLFFFYLIIVSIRQRRYSFLLILLFFLTFQLHFSLFLFFPIFLTIVLWKRKKIKLTKRYLAFTFIAVLISILPLLLFDLRHDFLISKNAIDFLIKESPGNYFDLKHLRKFSLSFWNFSSHLFFPKTSILSTVFLSLVGTSFIFRIRKNENLKILAIFLVVTFVLLFFYKGQIPDYYFLYLSPVIFYLVSESLTQIKWLAYLFLLFLVFQNIKAQSQVINPYNFFIKLKAVKYLKSRSQNQAVRVLLDTDLGLGFGFDYLMDYVGIVRTNDLDAPPYQISLRDDKSVALSEFKEEGLPVGIKIKAL